MVKPVSNPSPPPEGSGTFVFEAGSDRIVLNLSDTSLRVGQERPMLPYCFRRGRCLLWSTFILAWACGQPGTSSPPAGGPPDTQGTLLAQLKASGAEVQSDSQGNITLLNLYWTNLTDDDLKILGGLNQLRTIILPARATMAGIQHLQGLTSLAELYPPSEITDGGLAGLGNLSNLKELYLYGSKITDAGFPHLKVLHQLEFLGVQHTEVTGSGLVHLQGLTKLAWLDLSYTKISDMELEPLQKLSQLKAVGLYGTQISSDGIQGLKAALPNCTVLYR